MALQKNDATITTLEDLGLNENSLFFEADSNSLETPSEVQHFKKYKDREEAFESFVEKSREKYGDKFTYSFENFDLGLYKEKVGVVCKHHGYTILTKTAHLTSDCGCQKCNLTARNLIIFKKLEEKVKTTLGKNYNLVFNKNFPKTITYRLFGNKYSVKRDTFEARIKSVKSSSPKIRKDYTEKLLERLYKLEGNFEIIAHPVIDRKSTIKIKCLSHGIQTSTVKALLNNRKNKIRYACKKCGYKSTAEATLERCGSKLKNTATGELYTSIAEAADKFQVTRWTIQCNLQNKLSKKILKLPIEYVK